MILRRYGNALHSVELNFDSKALTEIGFRRDRVFSLDAEELARAYTLAESYELTESEEGDVQDEVEQRMLAVLERRIREIETGLGEGELLVVESEQGVDYPKTRTDQKTIVVEGENRLHFTIRVAPPLRLGRYRKVG
jgi:hypothetical protein